MENAPLGFRSVADCGRNSGLPMSVRVHPANVHDSVGAKEALESMRYKFPGLRRILADGGYRGETVRNTVRRLLRCDLKVVLRSDKRTKPCCISLP